MNKRDSGGLFSFSLAVMFIAGVVFFCLSVIVLGVLPGMRLDKSIVQNSPVSNVPYTGEEWRGRQIYAAQGCAYCHTQQVRFTPEDRRRFGPSTEAWETRYDSPQLWGTRRIGPDLARESGVRSDDWQYAHLYNPRAVVSGSVMPAYPWMFDGSAARPGNDARALVAYLRTLGRARDEQEKAQTAEAGQRYANPSRPIPAVSGSVQAGLPLPPGNAHNGQRVWSHYCSACHGGEADGQTLAAASLRPAPANLTAFNYDPQAFAAILHNGVAGSAMPAWRDLSPQQVADVYAWLRDRKQQKATVSASPLLAASIAQGATLYAENCTTCHGINGDGKGPSAALYAPAPFNFLHLQPDMAEIDRVVRNGIPGSAMPPFPQFSAEQRADLARYIRSLHTSEQPSTVQR
ncbi:cbb3-type cytochrome c oxidase subunit II [Erwinia sp. B116]|uniref:cbb3-type cytochrome c oxidase subunit II n=1 Tax=Erwinia sp. B116 TaxID=1561024 RepID=UPI000C75E2FF|nr:cbb3-type cytochrome c oxidase subunit II [Erwinia sp. B116]PLV61015.1 hypothetical protein NV64_10460 [Erwinia sp. B116]